ncbi:MAG: GNAT family N-acetyltransferase, partial [Bacteroidales bacterium]|nr:GNAT family N-acetyltransferase [Bacteroidales bacterium]
AFIEYIPAENAWAPVEAPGYTYIDCFWVSGKYKGHGFGTKLLEECENNAKDKNGLVILSSKKKMPFLSDKKYLIKKGFKVCDFSPPYFELLVKKFKDAPQPKFKSSVKAAKCDEKKGLVFYYSNHCPFMEPWINRISKYAESKGFKIKVILISDKSEAQNAPSPFTNCSIFYKGNFLTHELTVESKFDKYLEKIK